MEGFSSQAGCQRSYNYPQTKNKRCMDIVAFLCPMLYQHGNCILKKKGKVQIQIRVCLTIEVALNLGEEIG
jgi:hypothetical protein